MARFRLRRGSHQQGWIGKGSRNQRQHQFWRKDAARQGHQPAKRMAHEDSRPLYHFFQKGSNLGCPKTIVQTKGGLGGRAETDQIESIDAPSSCGQDMGIASPMPTACGESMDEDQGRMVEIPRVPPMALLSTPYPPPMGPPINIPVRNGDHPNTTGRCSLSMGSTTCDLACGWKRKASPRVRGPHCFRLARAFSIQPPGRPGIWGFCWHEP